MYVDPFAMGPWEELEAMPTGGAAGQPRSDFNEQWRRLPGRAEKGDLVASAFVDAATDCQKQAIDKYPNTAVLLRAGFPKHPWKMILHEIRDDKRADLETWTQKQKLGTYDVQGDWRPPTRFASINVTNRPVFLMLDPYKVVPTNYKDEHEPGYLSEQILRDMVGPSGLNLLARASSTVGPPTLITIFSYSDADPSVPDAIVRQTFGETGWTIELVQTKSYRVFTHDCVHQAWIVTNKLPVPLLGDDLQHEWDKWLKSR